MYKYSAKLIRVVDGDTIDAEIDLGFDIVIRQRVKLYGISTPDSRTPDMDEREKGLAAKAKLIDLLTKEFQIETMLNKRGKYGRIMGIVSVVQADGSVINVNKTLVAQGFAVEHTGVLKD